MLEWGYWRARKALPINNSDPPGKFDGKLLEIHVCGLLVRWREISVLFFNVRRGMGDSTKLFLVRAEFAPPFQNEHWRDCYPESPTFPSKLFSSSIIEYRLVQLHIPISISLLLGRSKDLCGSPSRTSISVGCSL
jgi:hypothetical protein